MAAASSISYAKAELTPASSASANMIGLGFFSVIFPTS
jgi:hypothetical protein